MRGFWVSEVAQRDMVRDVLTKRVKVENPAGTRQATYGKQRAKLRMYVNVDPTNHYTSQSLTHSRYSPFGTRQCYYFANSYTQCVPFAVLSSRALLSFLSRLLGELPRKHVPPAQRARFKGIGIVPR